MKTIGVRGGVAIAVAILLLSSICVHAQMGPLGARLPAGANAVLAIDVAKLLQSPLGKQLQLQSKLMSGYADRPLAVPATARQFVIAAAVHPTGMESIWQAAVIDLSTAPKLEPMLRAQGGYLDKIEGKRAAWTLRDIFYIELDDHTLGVVQPAQRQFVRRWLSGKGDRGLSPYLANALTAAGNAEVVFSVDLDDVIGATALRYAFGMGQFPSLEKIDAGQDKLINALASVKGMQMTMRVSDRINAEWIIDFDEDVSALGGQAEAFVVDVLTAAELYEGGTEKWNFKAEGKRITGKGTMDPDQLNKLIALLSPANVGDVDAATAAAPSAVESPAQPAPAAQRDPVTDLAVASQQYYRAVSKIIDSIGPKPSPTQGASWLIAQSRRIQQLPVLNVDPALVQWGNTVANTFTRAAQELGLGQQNAMVASQGIATPVASVAYTESGEGSSDTPESRAAFRNAQQQRRQVAQAERGAAAERAFNIVNEILPARGQIRMEMVQKYGIEF